MVDGRPHLGAVGAPAQGAVYGGIVGQGAWRQNGAGRHPIAARIPPAEGITVYASRHYADDPQLAAYLARYKVAKLTNIGSALKFCRLAEGAADFYPRLGRTMEWDTAAPQAVLEAAGGRVVTMADETPSVTARRGSRTPTSSASAAPPAEGVAQGAGQSQAAPRTPEESPCLLRTTGVSNVSLMM